MAKAASLPFTVRGSTDHGFTHGFWRRHRPWAPTGSPASAHATELSSVSTSQRIERGPWWQYRPQRSAWPSAAAQAKDTDMASGGSASHSQQHGPQQPQQHSPRMSAWVQVSVRTTDTCTAFAGGTGCGHPHRSRLQEDDGPDMDQNQRLLTVQFSFPFLSFLTSVSSFHLPSSCLPFLPFFFQVSNLSTAKLSWCFYFPRTEQSLREGNSPRL